MTDNPEKPNRSGFERFHDAHEKHLARKAAEQALWQRRVRGYLVRIFADMRQLKHPPRQEDWHNMCWRAWQSSRMIPTILP